MTPNKLKTILAFFDETYPDVKGELTYTKDYELLIAVVLSAQSTDKSVNQVTAKLFADYPNFNTLKTLKEAEFAVYFKTLGLYRNKAKHIYQLVEMLEKKFEGKVPESKEELLTLPGVGVKTANVVRGELFNIPEIAVDTHVSRVSKRLGFAAFDDNVNTIELKLQQAIDKKRWIKTHHQMIHFGRYFCKAQNPRCQTCPLVKLCLEKNKNL